jgi:predicted TIM-barrel fold metal-dependent hydrolase
MARADAANLCMGICGRDHYIHGSDYPFIPYAASLKWAEAVDAPLRDAVMNDNVRRLYGI